jgi:TRAP-type C4-dicarboxylate transport system permease small subunit
MVKKLANIYDHMEEILLVVCLLIMVVVIFLQVVMRYGFNNSLSWSEELARILFIWASWIGISFGQKKGEHIKITLVIDNLKGKARMAVLLLADVFTLAILAVLILKGFEITQKIFNMASTTPALYIPRWILYAAVPISCTLMSVRVLKSIWDKLRISRTGEVI